ncbi:LysR family transcriptional regulator [Paucibacter sp. B2R-40]|uniref:LysR family transcriptional regulator n=1 Tax=Paucibacter sp. B2R-40 TaxID=2893554 RepID=UPI0021E448F1|nr:LysR family transcriptional regulator [Paucibacter sp. B2R-40]MCV2355220.1 LysR family transcriptional regulator [Paucibacter sp. B2R-40]
MDKLTAMQVFVAVVDSGSQSAAAEQLDLSRPVVSRYLAELEAWAGARLMHRTTRKLSLTAAGHELLPRCRQLLDLSADMQAAVALPDKAPQGLLRLTASSSFGQAQLARVVAEFVALYPAVSVDLVLLDRAVNLVEERIDLGVRISNELDPHLIARRLTVCRSVLCAAPSYLQQRGTPKRLEELSQHNCLSHFYYGKSLWTFEQDGAPASVATSVNVSGNVSANDAGALMQAALAGAGVALLPTYLAGEHLRAGRLLALLPDLKPTELSIYAVYASRKNMPAALRVMLDFLAEQFAPEPLWDSQ